MPCNTVPWLTVAVTLDTDHGGFLFSSCCAMATATENSRSVSDPWSDATGRLVGVPRVCVTTVGSVEPVSDCRGGTDEGWDEAVQPIKIAVIVTHATPNNRCLITWLGRQRTSIGSTLNSVNPFARPTILTNG